MKNNPALKSLRYHVTGAIERGEGEAITAVVERESKMKIVPIEITELIVVECDCGFHLGLDFTFIDQVSEIKTNCPSCKAEIDTSKLKDDE